MQVLMIEDIENDFLLVNRFIAKLNDVKIEWRNTLEKGLAYVESNPVDVLLLDMALPDSYGMAALKQVQTRFPALPIIILSGNDTDELVLETIRQGAQDYLVKGQVDGQILDRSLHYAVERKRLEKRFHSLLEAAPDATVIVHHDGNIVLVNSQTERIFGYSRDELIGKPVEILVPASFRTDHPEYRSQYTSAPRVRMLGIVLELYALRKDGSQFPVEISLSPIETEDGVLIASAIRDISERKQVEQALRNSEEQFRSAFNYAAIGKALVALDGRWLQVNHALCSILGYSEPELLTKTFQDITHPDDLDTDLNYIGQLLAGEIETYQMEKRYFHKHGHQVWVLLSVSLVRGSEKQPLHFISQIQDITERKQTEKLLIENVQKEQEFQNYLKALHAITVELTNVSNLDELYKRAVELGLQRLGFDRLGILLYNQEDSVAIGTYGTDSTGNRVAEHHLRIDPSSLTGILMRALQKDEHFVVDEHAQLFSNLEPIGTGWNAVAVLWNGTEKLGWLTTDNGVQHLPLTQTQLNVLALYAVTLGTLLAQKQAQVSLRESERRLRLVAQNSPDVIYIMSLTEQRATYLNRSEFLGYSQSEIEQSGSLVNAIHPNDKERVLAHWREVMVDGELNPVEMIEYRLQDKSGQWRWIQSRETIFAATSDGKPSQVLVTLTDITERKQAEANLTQERDLLRTLIDSSPDYIFIKDREGRFILSNIAHAQAASLNADELVGKTAFEAFPPELAAQFHADDQRVIQSGEPLINMERVTVDESGNAKTVLTTKIPLRDKDGQVMSLVGISRDITARKQFEAQTIELAIERDRVKVLQRFVHDMSHDFRTPLSVINTSLYLLQKQADPQKQQVYAKRAEDQILRMDKLLAELLQMEHLDQDETTFQFSLTEINAFLTTIIRDYEPLVIAKQITVEFVSDTDNCLARIDTVEFARVMTKLMDKAIAYTPEGGKITIRTNTQSRWVIISVQDTGIGIAPNDLPHIFERFYRADQARSTKTGGSGLGLSIVQKIVEAHNGKVEVESILGQGSKFSIKLPSS